MVLKTARVSFLKKILTAERKLHPRNCYRHVSQYYRHILVVEEFLSRERWDLNFVKKYFSKRKNYDSLSNVK